MKKMNSLKLSLVFCSIAALLACGGGTKDITLADGNPTPDAFAPVSSKPTTQGVSNAAGYGDPNVQAAFDILNGARGRCGFGYWAKSAELEQSAIHHTSYMATNNVSGHTEDPALPGFTGREVRDRAYAAGFDARYDQGELVGIGGSAQDIAYRLLSATYHLGGVIGSTQKVGMAAGISGNGTYLLTIDVADINYLGQHLASNTVSTYPCQGESVATNHANEIPNPLPDRAAQSYGPPFALRTRDDQKINVTSYSIKAGGAPIEVTLLNSETDGSGQIQPSQAYVIPLSPLTSGVEYTFDASGDVGGVPFTTHYTTVAR